MFARNYLPATATIIVAIALVIPTTAVARTQKTQPGPPLVTVPVPASVASDQRWDYLRGQAKDLYAESSYDRALVAAEQSLEIALKHFAKNDFRLGISYNNIAANQYALGNYQTAFETYDQAIAVYEAAYGGDNYRIATALSNQAEAARFLEIPRIAEEKVRRAVRILELPENYQHRPRLLAAYSNLGSLRQDAGDFAEAETLQVKALALSQGLYGDMSAETANAKTKLAHVKLYLGQEAEAKAMLLASIPILERELGADHSDVAYAKEGLADVLTALGEYDASMVVINEAFENHIRRFGKDSHNLSDAHFRRAEIYLQTGRYAEAEQDLLKAEKFWAAEFGDEYFLVLDAKASRAVVYSKQERFAEAEALALGVLAVQEKRKAEPIKIVGALLFLHDLYEKTERYPEQASMMQRAEALRDSLIEPTS